MTVFVDTSFYVALIMPRDQWHARAVRAMRPSMRMFTSAPVITETISLLQSRGLLSTALQFLSGIRDNSELTIIYPDAATQVTAWQRFAKLAGTGANGVDSMSFVIMEQLAIRKALSFDQHFRSAGFETLP